MGEKTVFSRGSFFHGTRADLKMGDMIVTGKKKNYNDDRKSQYVYFAGTLDAAIWGAELAEGEGKERIYVVEPTGDFEDDPNVTDIDYMPPVPMGAVFLLRHLAYIRNQGFYKMSGRDIIRAFYRLFHRQILRTFILFPFHHP